MQPPRLPSDSDHVAIAGRTGSGKTFGALAMLARQDLDKRPWFIIDHKGDDSIKSLDREEVSLSTRFLPDKGLFVIRPKYGERKDRMALEDFFVRVFKKRKAGIYVDEGHLVGPSPALRNIFVAGRSHKVTVMWCSQRAAQIDPFIWSQASFYRVFALQTALDIKRFNENFPMKFEQLPEFHSYYYDVKRGKVHLLAPAPHLADTKSLLDAKLYTGYGRL